MTQDQNPKPDPSGFEIWILNLELVSDFGFGASNLLRRPHFL
jgi:hypothetical protein